MVLVIESKAEVEGTKHKWLTKLSRFWKEASSATASNFNANSNPASNSDSLSVRSLRGERSTSLSSLVTSRSARGTQSLASSRSSSPSSQSSHSVRARLQNQSHSQSSQSQVKIQHQQAHVQDLRLLRVSVASASTNSLADRPAGLNQTAAQGQRQQPKQLPAAYSKATLRKALASRLASAPPSPPSGTLLYKKRQESSSSSAAQQRAPAQTKPLTQHQPPASSSADSQSVAQLPPNTVAKRAAQTGAKSDSRSVPHSPPVEYHSEQDREEAKESSSPEHLILVPSPRLAQPVRASEDDWRTLAPQPQPPSSANSTGPLGSSERSAFSSPPRKAARLGLGALHPQPEALGVAAAGGKFSAFSTAIPEDPETDSKQEVENSVVFVRSRTNNRGSTRSDSSAASDSSTAPNTRVAPSTTVLEPSSVVSQPLATSNVQQPQPQPPAGQMSQQRVVWIQDKRRQSSSSSDNLQSFASSITQRPQAQRVPASSDAAALRPDQQYGETSRGPPTHDTDEVVIESDTETNASASATVTTSKKSGKSEPGSGTGSRRSSITSDSVNPDDTSSRHSRRHSKHGHHSSHHASHSDLESDQPQASTSASGGERSGTRRTHRDRSMGVESDAETSGLQRHGSRESLNSINSDSKAGSHGHLHRSHRLRGSSGSSHNTSGAAHKSRSHRHHASGSKSGSAAGTPGHKSPASSRASSENIAFAVQDASSVGNLTLLASNLSAIGGQTAFVIAQPSSIPIPIRTVAVIGAALPEQNPNSSSRRSIESLDTALDSRGGFARPSAIPTYQRRQQQAPDSRSLAASIGGAADNVSIGAVSANAAMTAAGRPEVESILKKGWLYKQNSGDVWSKHWFVLNGTTLRYFRDARAEEGENVEGIIDLSSCDRVVPIDSGKNFAFQLSTLAGVVTLSAMTAGIRQNWLQCIQKCLQQKGSGNVSGTASRDEVGVYFLETRRGEPVPLSAPPGQAAPNMVIVSVPPPGEQLPPPLTSQEQSATVARAPGQGGKRGRSSPDEATCDSEVSEILGHLPNELPTDNAAPVPPAADAGAKTRKANQQDAGPTNQTKGAVQESGGIRKVSAFNAVVTRQSSGSGTGTGTDATPETASGAPTPRVVPVQIMHQAPTMSAQGTGLTGADVVARAELERVEGQRRALEERIGEQSGRIEELERHVRETGEQLEQERLLLAQHEQLVQQRAEELDYLQNRLKQRDCECEKLAQQLSEARATAAAAGNVSAAASELALAKQRNVKYAEEVASLRRQLEETEQSRNELEQYIASCVQSYQERGSQKSVETLDTLLTLNVPVALVRNMGDFVFVLRNALAEGAEASQRAEQMEAELQAGRQQKNYSETLIRELEAENSEIAGRLRALEQSDATARQEAEQLRGAVEEATEDRDRLRKALSDQRAECNDLRVSASASIQTLRNELSTKQEQIDSAIHNLSELERMQSARISDRRTRAEQLVELAEHELDRVDQLAAKRESTSAEPDAELDAEPDDSAVQQYRNLFLKHNPFIDTGVEKAYSREEKAIAFINHLFAPETLVEACESEEKFLELLTRVFRQSIRLVRYFLVQYADDRNKIAAELQNANKGPNEQAVTEVDIDPQNQQLLSQKLLKLINQTQSLASALHGDTRDSGISNSRSGLLPTGSPAFTRSQDLSHDEDELDASDSDGPPSANSSRPGSGPSGPSGQSLQSSIVRLVARAASKLKRLTGAAENTRARLAALHEEMEKLIASSLRAANEEQDEEEGDANVTLALLLRNSRAAAATELALRLLDADRVRKEEKGDTTSAGRRPALESALDKARSQVARLGSEMLEGRLAIEEHVSRGASGASKLGTSRPISGDARATAAIDPIDVDRARRLFQLLAECSPSASAGASSRLLENRFSSLEQQVRLFLGDFLLNPKEEKGSFSVEAFLSTFVELWQTQCRLSWMALRHSTELTQELCSSSQESSTASPKSLAALASLVEAEQLLRARLATELANRAERLEGSNGKAALEGVSTTALEPMLLVPPDLQSLMLLVTRSQAAFGALVPLLLALVSDVLFNSAQLPLTGASGTATQAIQALKRHGDSILTLIRSLAASLLAQFGRTRTDGASRVAALFSRATPLAASFGRTSSKQRDQRAGVKDKMPERLSEKALETKATACANAARALLLAVEHCHAPPSCAFVETCGETIVVPVCAVWLLAEALLGTDGSAVSLESYIARVKTEADAHSSTTSKELVMRIAALFGHEMGENRGDAADLKAFLSLGSASATVASAVGELLEQRQSECEHLTGEMDSMRRRVRQLESQLANRPATASATASAAKGETSGDQQAVVEKLAESSRRVAELEQQLQFVRTDYEKELERQQEANRRKLQRSREELEAALKGNKSGSDVNLHKAEPPTDTSGTQTNISGPLKEQIDNGSPAAGVRSKSANSDVEQVRALVARQMEQLEQLKHESLNELQQNWRRELSKLKELYDRRVEQDVRRLERELSDERRTRQEERIRYEDLIGSLCTRDDVDALKRQDRSIFASLETQCSELAEQLTSRCLEKQSLSEQKDALRAELETAHRDAAQQSEEANRALRELNRLRSSVGQQHSQDDTQQSRQLQTLQSRATQLENELDSKTRIIDALRKQITQMEEKLSDRSNYTSGRASDYRSSRQSDSPAGSDPDSARVSGSSSFSRTRGGIEAEESASMRSSMTARTPPAAATAPLPPASRPVLVTGGGASTSPTPGIVMAGVPKPAAVVRSGRSARDRSAPVPIAPIAPASTVVHGLMLRDTYEGGHSDAGASGYSSGVVRIAPTSRRNGAPTPPPPLSSNMRRTTSRSSVDDDESAPTVVRVAPRSGESMQSRPIMAAPPSRVSQPLPVPPPVAALAPSSNVFRRAVIATAPLRVTTDYNSSRRPTYETADERLSHR